MGLVVVTGVSSFVGMHLAEAFAAAGWRVLATHSRELESYTGVRAQRIQRIERQVELVRLDLRDHAAINKLVVKSNPRLWVQHAGYAENYVSPDYDLATAGIVNVAPLGPLYSALGGSRCGVIVTGSSMEYGRSNKGNREDEACWPETPYGVSKLMETLTARLLAFRYNVPTRVARLYIPFGPLDNPNKLIMSVRRALVDRTQVELSPCEQQRDFIAVEDVCKGYLALAADLPRCIFDVFNLCSGRAIPLKSLLLAMAEAANRPASLLCFGAIPMRAGEPAVSFGDNTKAREILRWLPAPPEQAIVRMVSEESPSPPVRIL